MKILKLSLLPVLVSLFAQVSYADIAFQNLREAPSRFIDKGSHKKVDELITYYGENFLDSKYSTILESPDRAQCASFIVSDLEALEIDSSVQTHIFAMRKLDIIDDIVVKLLLEAADVKRRVRFGWLPKDYDQRHAEIYQQFSSDIDSGACPENSYLSLVQSLKNEEIEKRVHVRSTNIYARRNKDITRDQYDLVEGLRQAKVQEWGLTLSHYYQSLEAVRRFSPNITKDRSEFVTREHDDSGLSLRQYLYQGFNYYQILYMSDLVEKFKRRLSSNEISIVIEYDRESDEVISLSPMERFRFVVKLLRKEIDDMNNSQIFEGRRATYAAVIAAAYETGLVSAKEIDSLYELKEIWSPEKSRLEKILYWSKRFGGTASLLVPGPYSFLPLLSIMVIESLTIDPKPRSDLNFSLF